MGIHWPIYLFAYKPPELSIFFSVTILKTRKAQATSSLTPERKVTPITCVEGESERKYNLRRLAIWFASDVGTVAPSFSSKKIKRTKCHTVMYSTRPYLSEKRQGALDCIILYNLFWRFYRSDSATMPILWPRAFS